jgi:hypothetical protein
MYEKRKKKLEIKEFVKKKKRENKASTWALLDVTTCSCLSFSCKSTGSVPTSSP